MTEPALEVDGLTVRYGGVVAVSDVRFSVVGGEVKGLIGPNGAGKSSLINAVSGVTAPASGSIRVRGRDVTRAGAAGILASGVARTFQQAQLAVGMTVEQNLMLPRLDKGLKDARERARDLAGTIGIADLLDLPARSVAFGARRLVEIARALMTSPSVLLLDEPGAGLTLGEKHQLSKLIRRLAGDGVAVLLVDHDMGLVLTTCDAVVVLDAGTVLATGTPTEIRSNPVVVEAYLGAVEASSRA